MRFNQLLIPLLFTIVLLNTCVSVPDPAPLSQATIVEVLVEPNPVVVGDSAKFTCIIETESSLTFKYTWLTDNNSGVQDTVTTVNTITWIAPNKADTVYEHYVYVDNGDIEKTSPGKYFSIEVIDEN